MTKAELKKTINTVAKAIKQEYKNSIEDKKDIKPAVDISHHSLYIAFNHNDYFFQGDEAQNLWDEANVLSDKSDTSVENCLLYLSTSW